jgi:hypothetical protein
MPFQRKTHPLNWGDKEIRWLISTGMNKTNIYRAMGYKGQPTRSFISRLAALEEQNNA